MGGLSSRGDLGSHAAEDRFVGERVRRGWRDWRRGCGRTWRLTQMRDRLGLQLAMGSCVRLLGLWAEHDWRIHRCGRADQVEEGRLKDTLAHAEEGSPVSWVVCETVHETAIEMGVYGHEFLSVAAF